MYLLYCNYKDWGLHCVLVNGGRHRSILVWEAWTCWDSTIFLFCITLYGMIFSIFLISHKPNSLWWCSVSAPSPCDGVKLYKNGCRIICFALWVLPLLFSLSCFYKAMHTFLVMIKTYFLRKYLYSSFSPPQLLIIPLCLMCDVYHSSILYCFP